MDIVGKVEKCIKQIPGEFKNSLVSTYLIGLIAYLQFYVVPIFSHDNAYVYLNRPGSFFEGATYDYNGTVVVGASGGRWGEFIPFYLTGFINMTWLKGVINLLLYSLAAYIVIKLFEIKRPLLIFLTSGIMVTSPTLISQNMYMGELLSRSFALLFSCLAVYTLYEKKRGSLYCFVCLLLCESLYAGYIGVTLTLFLMKCLIDIIELKVQSEKAFVWKHLKMVILVGSSMLLSYIINMAFVMLDTKHNSNRVNSDVSQITDFLQRVIDIYKYTFRAFLPGGRSFFWGNRILFFLFWMTAVLSLFFLILIIKKNKIYNNIILFDLLCLDLYLMPFAMSCIYLVSFSRHIMLEWAYTCPWVFFIALIRPITGESENTEKKRSNAILTLYTGMILLLESLTIINGIYAANMAFMNNHVAYESAMELLTRISDRIESAEGYQPGVSKVCIVGSPVPYYAMKRPGFEFAESITGLVTQTSMDAAYSMQHFLTQQAGLNINLVGMYYEGNIDLKKIEKNLRDKGFSVDEKVFEKKYYEAKGFPNRDCTFWYNDLLIVKLSDGGVNEEE